MKFFTSKNLLNQAKIVWKSLVVLLLSALLLAPTPVLALDYNVTPESYLSNLKVELDGVLTSIKKLQLPNLSYENGKTTLAEIESKLEKIQSNAGENAANFQKLSDETQKEYARGIGELKYLPDVVYAPYMWKLSARQMFSDHLSQRAKVIVLTNQISLLCDNLEKRINLARQKFGNVKEYADALRSFSDPDILTEISELDRFIADLTNNLPLGS